MFHVRAPTRLSKRPAPHAVTSRQKLVDQLPVKSAYGIDGRSQLGEVSGIVRSTAPLRMALAAVVLLGRVLLWAAGAERT